MMIIEDEPLLLKAITEKCKLAGIEVSGYPHGKDALKTLADATQSPDIIWLDYYLPDMNGLEFINEYHTLREHSDIPIMVVSNSTSPEKVGELIKLGVREYVLKAEHRLEDIIQRAQKLALSTNTPKTNTAS